MRISDWRFRRVLFRSAATKYLSGHSDVMLGAMTAANADIFRRLKDAARYWGNCVSPDDCYLVHRGLRTLEVRLERHQRNALELIDWFQQQPEVRQDRKSTRLNSSH